MNEKKLKERCLLKNSLIKLLNLIIPYRSGDQAHRNLYNFYLNY